MPPANDSDLSGRADQLVLTIDVGSSSFRTNLYTRDAHPVEGCAAQTHYATLTTADGGAEIDPDSLLDKIFAAIDETLHAASERAGMVAGVGMCSLVSNVMGIDAQGRPTTPIYTWADTRCASEAADLRASLDEAAIHERTGCYIHTSYLPARLAWLQHTAPDVYARTVMWITMGDWLMLHLFGRTAQSLSVASWSGLLNRHNLDWDAEWLGYLGLGREKLPPLVDVAEGISGLRAEYASRWPALRDVQWFPCVGDGVASNIGSGCWEPDAVAVQVGTSGAMRALLHGEVSNVPQGLWCYRLSGDAALLGGALSEGGNVFAWLRDTLRIADWNALEKEAANLPPDSHGLTLLPFVAGERSPGWNPAARATISGLSLTTTPVDIIRAAQEAIAYRFGLIYDQLLTALPPLRSVIASGGALLNTPGWIGMLADVLGTPVTASGEPEASSKGVALLTLHSLGIIKSFGEVPVSLHETYAPDMKRHAIYRRAMTRQQGMYEELGGSSTSASTGTISPCD